MGNKVDLIEFESDRFMERMVREFIESKNILMFAECSALTNSNICEPISEFYQEIFNMKQEKLHKNYVSSRRKIDIKKKVQQTNLCC